MQVSVRMEGDVMVVHATGKMMVGEPGMNVLDTVQEALGTGHRKFVLNLAEVTRVDSSGVGEIAAAHTSAKRKGGRLRLVGLSPKLAEVLQITQLLGVMEAYDDEKAALAAFGQD